MAFTQLQQTSLNHAYIIQTYCMYIHCRHCMFWQTKANRNQKPLTARGEASQAPLLWRPTFLSGAN